MNNVIYNNALEGCVGNINTGEIWYACKRDPDGTVEVKARSNKRGEIHVGGNEQHEPIIMSDFYHLKNVGARAKLTHAQIRENSEHPEWTNFESLNLGSVAEMLVKVANGFGDAYVGIGGPKGYEMAAAYPILKSAGAYVLNADTGEELGSTIVEPDKRIPIIAAKDEGLARKILQAIKA